MEAVATAAGATAPLITTMFDLQWAFGTCHHNGLLSEVVVTMAVVAVATKVGKMAAEVVRSQHCLVLARWLHM